MFKKGILIFGTLVITGVVCNFTVIYANDGRMPVLNNWPEWEETSRHCRMNDQTRLNFLGDRFVLRTRESVYFFSFGDALIMIARFPLMLCVSAFAFIVTVKGEALKLIRQAPSPRRLGF